MNGPPTTLARNPIVVIDRAALDGAVLPTRSEIERWTEAIDGLASSATALRASAQRLDVAADAHVQQISAPGGSAWEGDAADEALNSAYRDRGVVYRASDYMREAAKIANAGAQNLHFAQTLALEAIAEAEADGFLIGDDLTVIDAHGSLRSYAARKVLADMHSGFVAMRASALAAEDAEVGSRLEARAEALRAMIPAEWARSDEVPNGVVKAVNYTPLPQSPQLEPEDPVDALAVRDARDVHRIVDPLPPGRQPGVKTLPTPEAIQGLYGQLTEDSMPGPPSTYPGQWRVLEDGTKIGLRTSSKFGGPTVEIWYPDGTKTDVHLPEPPRPPVPIPVPAPVALPAPNSGSVPAVEPEDLGLLGVIAGIGAGILVAVGTLGQEIFSP